MSFPSQLESKRNVLAAELNEKLRRRRVALQSQIESIGKALDGGNSSVDDLDVRKREVTSLKKQIKDLERSIKSKQLPHVLKHVTVF